MAENKLDMNIEDWECDIDRIGMQVKRGIELTKEILALIKKTEEEEKDSLGDDCNFEECVFRALAEEVFLKHGKNSLMKYTKRETLTPEQERNFIAEKAFEAFKDFPEEKCIDLRNGHYWYDFHKWYGLE